MHSLQSLHIKIGFSPQNRRKAALTQGLWFEELKRIGREGTLRVFEVEVNWPRLGHWGPLGDVLAVPGVEDEDEDEDEAELGFRLVRTGFRIDEFVNSDGV